MFPSYADNDGFILSLFFSLVRNGDLVDMVDQEIGELEF